MCVILILIKRYIAIRAITRAVISHRLYRQCKVIAVCIIVSY